MRTSVALRGFQIYRPSLGRLRTAQRNNMSSASTPTSTSRAPAISKRHYSSSSRSIRGRLPNTLLVEVRRGRMEKVICATVITTRRYKKGSSPAMRCPLIRSTTRPSPATSTLPTPFPSLLPSTLLSQATTSLKAPSTRAPHTRA